MMLVTLWAFNLLLAQWGLSIGAALSAPVPWSSSANKFHPALPELLGTSIEEVQRGLKSKHFTSVQLVEAYLKRIEEVNPYYHAVLEVNPDALAIAQALDAERSAGTKRGYVYFSSFRNMY